MVEIGGNRWKQVEYEVEIRWPGGATGGPYTSPIVVGNQPGCKAPLWHVLDDKPQDSRLYKDAVQADDE
jgi:hypothetical protein